MKIEKNKKSMKQKKGNTKYIIQLLIGGFMNMAMRMLGLNIYLVILKNIYIDVL